MSGTLVAVVDLVEGDLVDLEGDPYLATATATATDPGAAETARRAATNSYAVVMDIVPSGDGVVVGFDEVCISVWFPSDHVVDVANRGHR